MISDRTRARLRVQLEALAQIALDEMDVTKWPTANTTLARQERYQMQRQAGRTLDTMNRIASILVSGAGGAR